MNNIYVFLADGFEEIEALTVVDICRRAGLSVVMVSISSNRIVIGSHKIPVVADFLLREVSLSDAQAFVLPGGMPGTKRLEACEPLMEALDAQYKKGGFVCAICAAPSILGHRGMLKGRRATCYPSFEKDLKGAQVTDAPAVTDAHVITGRGMGCALHFSLEILRQILGEDAAREMREKVVFPE